MKGTDMFRRIYNSRLAVTLWHLWILLCLANVVRQFRYSDSRLSGIGGFVVLGLSLLAMVLEQWAVSMDRITRNRK